VQMLGEGRGLAAAFGLRDGLSVHEARNEAFASRVPPFANYKRGGADVVVVRVFHAVPALQIECCPLPMDTEGLVPDGLLRDGVFTYAESLQDAARYFAQPSLGVDGSSTTNVATGETWIMMSYLALSKDGAPVGLGPTQSPGEFVMDMWPTAATPAAEGVAQPPAQSLSSAADALAVASHRLSQTLAMAGVRTTGVSSLRLEGAARQNARLLPRLLLVLRVKPPTRRSSTIPLGVSPLMASKSLSAVRPGIAMESQIVV